jgi:SAM-dependent methyltransferase
MRDLADAMTDRGRALSFWLRNHLPWSLPPWKRNAGSWTAALASLPPAAQSRAEELARRAPELRERWPALLSPLELHENLYLLDLLARHLPATLPEAPGLDVGSKNGLTLPALVAASLRGWDLVELDAHRRYATLSTRRAHGERIAKEFPGCRYIAGSVLDCTGAYAVITWILPFVHEAPLRAWGLPRRFFEPERLFRHVAGLLAPGGVLFIVNQGEGEHETQKRLFTEVGLAPDDLGPLESVLSPFRRTRFGFRWQRPRA